MIYVAHGRFDKTGEANGVTMLVQELREYCTKHDLSENIKEGNWNEWPEFSKFELSEEPNIAIGYSNGAHQVKRIIEKLVCDEDITKLREPEDVLKLTHLRWHVILLDFVLQGAGQWFPHGSVRFAKNVISGRHFVRTLDLGMPVAIHSHMDTVRANFEEILVEADHGKLPAVPWVRDVVCNRVKEIFSEEANA